MSVENETIGPLTWLQTITLRDILVTTGLSGDSVANVSRLLSEKTDRAVLVFYYRACGLTFEEVGERVGVARQVATRMIYDECANIAVYLRDGGAFW